ncbi:MAG: cytochrome c biogenesis protein CcsA, partial [candidate division NC10 bacterium]|nr:cytochrome c biogenesis protein CcsA [candidate division NC10 bacterium]
VLGWGGYWAWDPVENASIMPWFTGTAFLHSVMIQEKRQMLKVWNLILITLTFFLVIFGTFLTRSGILSSVHAFAEGLIGHFFLGFLALILLSSTTLLVFRAEGLKGHGELDSLLSRESAFLLNNLVLVGICFTVFLGTIFPLLAEAVRGVKVSVGAPYFNQVAVPLGLALLVLMGVGPLIAWRRASWDSLRRSLLLPFLLALLGGLPFFLLGIRRPLVLAASVAALFVILTVLFEFARGARARQKLYGEGFPQALVILTLRNRRRYGGFIVHGGVALAALGIAFSSSYQVESERAMRPGEVLEVGRYRLRFDGLRAVQGPTHIKVEAAFWVTNQEKPLGALKPALRFYERQQNPIAEVDYRIGLQEDLYVILGRVERDGREIAVKALVNPMVTWIWLGGAVMALGGLLALFPEQWLGRPRVIPPPEEKRSLAGSRG